MDISRSFRPHGAGLALALVALLVAAVPGSIHPQPATAQSPVGGGRFCPGALAAGLACNPIAPSTIVCPNGSVVGLGQSCSSAGFPGVAQFCPGAAAAGLACEPATSVISAPAVSAYVAPVTTETISLPADQYVLITNPWNTTAGVSGADIVVVFDSYTGGYDQTSTLAPGQSAWALSTYGGQATLTAFAS